MVHYIDKPDRVIEKITRACFPSYRGKKYKLSTSIPSTLRSYWDGGSRNDYVVYELATGKTAGVQENHPMFSDKPANLGSLPAGFVLVEHSIFCGKDMGITIYVNQAELAPMLPEAVALTEEEKTVLRITKRYKPAYRKEYLQAAGINPDRLEVLKASLISKGMLNKAGAITADGRNNCCK